MTRKRMLFLIVLLVPAFSVAGCGLIPTATPPTATPLFDIGPTPALELAGDLHSRPE